jgi:hypothetical protein
MLAIRHESKTAKNVANKLTSCPEYKVLFGANPTHY